MNHSWVFKPSPGSYQPLIDSRVPQQFYQPYSASAIVVLLRKQIPCAYYTIFPEFSPYLFSTYFYLVGYLKISQFKIYRLLWMEIIATAISNSLLQHWKKRSKGKHRSYLTETFSSGQRNIVVQMMRVDLLYSTLWI